MKIRLLFFVLTVISMAACQEVNKNLLVGKWQAVKLLEEGTDLLLDTNEVVFEFQSDQTYTYKSTLNYREAGTYFIEAHFLYTTDTINQASTEKAVEILLLSQDSLHLRMVEDGKERLLKLARR